MPRVVHIVTTGHFAGVERYVCDVAVETASRGWEVAVVGGNATRMPAALGNRVRWEPGTTAFDAAAIGSATRTFGRLPRAHDGG